MNPDTAPIAEIEAWLAPRLGWTNYGGKWNAPDGGGEYSRPIIGPSMDAAIGCLPDGWDWGAALGRWWCHGGPKRNVDVFRSGDPDKTHDELLRLACKAWMVQEENK